MLLPHDDSGMLTPRAIRTMHHRMDSSADDEFFVPVVQVLRLGRADAGDGGGKKWVVALSDGVHFLYGECDPALTPLIQEHVIAQNALIRIEHFAMADRGDRRVCLLLEAQKAAPNPGRPFGDPVDVRLYVPSDDHGEEQGAGAPAALRPLTGGVEEDAGAFFASRSAPRWQHGRRDEPHRRSMVAEVEKALIQAESIQNQGGAITEHRRKELSFLASRWELELYQNARSFEAYVDQSTFRDRIIRLSRSTDSKGEMTAHKHHRLHLLRHAIACREENCTATPFCRDIKAVWYHLQECDEFEGCQVPFCSTMKKLIQHSKTCVARNCKICTPDIRMPGCPLCEHEERVEMGEAVADDAQTSLRLQQDYLLTALHASTCPHEEDGQCLLSPLCFDLKKVWNHRTFCRDDAGGCAYPFCASMDHYQNCPSESCAVCVPVRATRMEHGIGRLSVAAGPGRGASCGPEMPTPTGPEVVASQVAIYDEIQKRNKRKLSRMSSPKPSAGPGAGVQSTDCSMGERHDDDEPMQEDDGLCPVVDGDGKQEAPPSSDGEGKEGNKDQGPEAGATYLATTHQTIKNTRAAVCAHCLSDLFVPPAATQFYCQECSNKTSSEVSA